VDVAVIGVGLTASSTIDGVLVGVSVSSGIKEEVIKGVCEGVTVAEGVRVDDNVAVIVIVTEGVIEVREGERVRSGVWV